MRLKSPIAQPPMLIATISLLVVFLATVVTCAQEPDPQYAFLEFVRREAAEMRRADKPPATLTDWERHRTALKQRLQEAWGEFPAEPCPLRPKTMGTLARDGYRVEKIVFQTLPDVWMTANAYVPDRQEKVPAVLCVHGHWRGAKQDPVVQARCIGLAKLGFFVLSVDAFGAGERGLTKALGEYHGEMVAATLFPAGLSLCGLQVYENMRAVDYLLTRPEVDGRRIGITGCSGGGNQTMYAGAWDERFLAVVPVCSVGNYQAYLGAACCMCEVVPEALRFTEEWGVLAMTAPRALRVISATRDAVQFSVEEARKSLALTRPVFELYGLESSLDHAVFEASHDYNREMRESMYGWMTRFLKDSGDGSPIAEPDLQTEEPEALRCFPGDTRPDDFMTIPRFAAVQARRLVAQWRPPSSLEAWQPRRDAALQGLARCLFGGEPPRPAPSTQVVVTSDGEGRTITFAPEPGLTLVARQRHHAAPTTRLAIVLDLDGAEKAEQSQLATTLEHRGWSVITLDLRATGKLAYPRDRIGRAIDHNTAEWSLWIGRPLLGQWVIDVRRLLDALVEHDGRLPEEVLLAGIGPAGLVAIGTAALEPRISRVATSDTLASYVTDAPYEGQRLGTIVPGILRDAGDVNHLAALIAPRRLVIGGGVAGDGRPLDVAALDAGYAFTRQVYDVKDAAGELRVLTASKAAAIVEGLE
ncbi:MAG: acetylxylan esterase [Planctomycetaceae bacterium]|nr:MAG: acetylxylan esterase [Planctomycetaceae bacterium]